jgi:hypothetical protein
MFVDPSCSPTRLAADTSPVQIELFGDERMEADLLSYAHREAARWGAERFAAEFRRRSEEEHRQRTAEARAFGYVGETDHGEGLAAVTNGPVDSGVSDRAVGSDPRHMDLHKPVRHAHVPRPPAPEAEPDRRRRRRRRERDRPAPESASFITAQEAARMSPGARRLYGIPDPPSPAVSPKASTAFPT